MSSTFTPRLALAVVFCMTQGWWGAGTQAQQTNDAPEAFSGPNAAQPLASDPDTAVRAAFERSKTAKSVQDYTEMIELCAKAQVIGLNESQSKYVKQLISWAHNRRGETYSDAAAKFTGEGNATKAREMDARALADFEIAVNNDGNRWKALHNRGVSYALVSRYDDALKDFTRVTELNPDYANGWFNRAEIQFELGHFDDAVADYDRMLKLDPNDLGGISGRGNAYFQLGRYREALLDCIQACRLDPNNAAAFTNRADAYLHLGMWEEAASDYQKATQMNSKLAAAFQGAAWLMATCPDDNYRNSKLAIQAAQRAIELLGPGETNYRYQETLAAAYANAGQFDQAQKTQALAIKAAPQSATARLQDGMRMYSQRSPFRMVNNEVRVGSLKKK